MSKIGLVGDKGEGGFAALRSRWFAQALEGCVVVDWRDPQLAQKLASVDAIVSAGVYGPSRAALRIVGDRPLCLDLAGDPFADAQAAAGVSASEVVAREAESVFIPALLRADAFTTISMRARFALLGQLGVLGRLARLPVGVDPVFYVPIPYEFPQAERPRWSGEGGRLGVMLCGSFNTWFDEECLLEGLLLAMDQRAIHVRCVAGGVQGHHTAGYARFLAGARRSRHAQHFTFLPMQSDAALAGALEGMHVGICMDRPGFEPIFGSRTRLMFYVHQGLSVIATPICEFSSDLLAHGYLQPVGLGDPMALARALLECRPPPDRSFLRQNYAVQAIHAPLQHWAAAPRRLPVQPHSDVLQQLLAERDSLQAELKALRSSRSFRFLNRLHRWGRGD